MSLCLIKPAQATGWAMCSPQGSDCDEGRGSSVCLPEREEVQGVGRKISASRDLEAAYPDWTEGGSLSKG